MVQGVWGNKGAKDFGGYKGAKGFGGNKGAKDFGGYKGFLNYREQLEKNRIYQFFKIKMNMEEFIIRTYTKKELALMYFPESNPRTAVNHLMAWIHLCAPLWEELLAMGYHKQSKAFTPKQVKAIVEYLGEPGV